MKDGFPQSAGGSASLRMTCLKGKKSHNVRSKIPWTEIRRHLWDLRTLSAFSRTDTRWPPTHRRKQKMPEEGLEPTHCCQYWILSPARLPFRHSGFAGI